MLEEIELFHPFVIVGDMNMDLFKQNANSKTFSKRFLSLRFKQIVTQSTEVIVFSETCLDHVLTNDHNIYTRVLETNILDYFGVLHEANCFAGTITAKKEAFIIRNFGKVLKNDDYCCKILFKLLRELQRIDHSKKMWMNYLIISHALWKKISISFFPNVNRSQWKDGVWKMEIKTCKKFYQKTPEIVCKIFEQSKWKKTGSVVETTQIMYLNHSARRVCKWNHLPRAADVKIQ